MATVFVFGAGPAGLFAAQKIGLVGHEVVIFNRDIKPGGLAEYGIYPLKDKMKIGLRKQFAKVLSLPNVHYFGNVPVGTGSPISLETLREFSPSAMVFAVGAQGTKKLGLPGEELGGVFSAKDFVYFYNRLPPFAGQDFSTGKRIAVIGMGNVMADIARWLLKDDPDRKAEEVIVIARRGPLEAKFDDKEFANIQMHLHRQSFQNELQRVAGHMAAVGQDMGKVGEETFPCLVKHPEERGIDPRLTFRFLSSPVSIAAGPDGRISRLTVAENRLINRNGSIAAEPTGATAELEVDTLIFAIGDTHDATVGLPSGKGGYLTNPDANDPGAQFEVFNEVEGKAWEGLYVVGWARKASEGLVGIARHDGETGAARVLEYLASAPPRESATVEQIKQFLHEKGIKAVPKSDLAFLTQAEEKEARARGVAWHQFPSNEAMLSAIERERSATAARSGS